LSTTQYNYDHIQCDKSWVNNHPGEAGRGITTWNLADDHKIAPLAPRQSRTLTFTCTVPKCYASNGAVTTGKDVCLIVFNAWIDKTSNAENDIRLNYELNGSTFTHLCDISREGGHGGTQAFDLCNIPNEIYNDMGKNTLIIKNTSAISTVHFEHFKIYRVYQMGNLIVDADPTYQCNRPCGCEPGFTAGKTGNLDETREDTPCNYNSGGGLSYSHYHNTVHADTIIVPGASCSWTFDFNNNYANNGYTGNYDKESICIFNFNQIWTYGGTASSLDNI
jgi:hypothetical protein